MRKIGLRPGETLLVQSTDKMPKGSSLEKLSPQKRRAITDLQTHITINFDEVYSHLAATETGDQGDLLAHLRGRKRIPDIIHDLEGARVTRRERRLAITAALKTGSNPNFDESMILTSTDQILTLLEEMS